MKMYLYKFSVRTCILFLAVLAEFAASYEKNCPLLKLMHGRIRYRFRGRNARFNCIRGYQLVGVKYSNCMNGKWDANAPFCVKNGCRAPSTTHVNGQFIESYRGAVVKIICNPGYNLIGSPTVFCNGYVWNETFPVCKVFNTNPALSCDFESDDLCGWSQDPLHDVDWIRKEGSSSSDVPVRSDNETSPVNGLGHYMYMRNLILQNENITARLYSPVYQASYSNGTCFKLWYYMHGENTGTLKVYIKPEEIELYDLIPSFWINEEQGKGWIQGYFPIEPMSTKFQIVIEGIKGAGYSGHTAFDDVKIISGDECSFLENLMTSTEFATSVSQDDDQYDDNNPLFSCRNRCNQSNSFALGDEENEKCSCHEQCIDTKTCCLDFYDYCQSAVSVSVSTESESQDFTATDYTQTDSSQSVTDDSIVVPPKSPSSSSSSSASSNNFNNKTNQIDQTRPIAGSLPAKSVDSTVKTSNEISKSGPGGIEQSKSEPKAEPKGAKVPQPPPPPLLPSQPQPPLSPLPPRSEKNVTKPETAKLPKHGPNHKEISKPTTAANESQGKKSPDGRPVINSTANALNTTTENDISKAGIDVGKIPSLRNVTAEMINRKLKLDAAKSGKAFPVPVTTSSTITPVRLIKNQKPNAIDPSLLEKASLPVLSNESRFPKGKSKSKETSGKEPPQAIKIDGGNEAGQGTVPGVLEIAGICSALLIIIIIIAVVGYRRNRSRKMERDSMVEDSDVRFLTSDEVLDFTLARPADDDL